MEDNNIIKILQEISDVECENCIYNGRKGYCSVEDCSVALSRIVLDLIDRQKAEIKKCENIIRLADKTIEKQSAEIKRLEQENFDRSLTVETWKWEAVKEFAERLKDKITMSPHSFISIDKWYIDNLVKEMVGE